MAKAIKEIIVLLLVCLVGMLLFAVLFYEYIPNRKVIPEVSKYEASEQVKQLKEDDIDKKDSQVVLTYQVTSSDLNNYKAQKEYVPGKANPFAPVSQDVEANATTKSNTNANTTNNNASQTTNRNSTTQNVSNSTNNTNSLIDDGGTK